MPFRSFTLSVVVRVVLLLATMTGLSLILGRADLFFNQIILGILLIIQVLELIRTVHRTNRDLAKLLLSIKHADFTLHFPEQRHDRSFRELYGVFREMIAAYQQVDTEREVQFQYLQQIIRHVRAGIISLKGDEIVLMNQSALDMLPMAPYKYWHHLQQEYARFAAAVEQLEEGKSKLTEITLHGENKRFSIHVVTVLLLGQPYRIITFQDVEEEINQSEIEAWHKLIRILTHEIMNSMTPIASLSETMLMLIEKEMASPGKAAVREGLLPDLAFSLRTLRRRSDGLLHFLDDYRRLTKVPLPQREVFAIRTLFDTVCRLMSGEVKKQQVDLQVSITPESLTLRADFGQIEQVLINLLTNSLQALQGVPNPVMKLAAWQQPDQTVVEVTDNGSGIDEDKLDKIFVPFYSTKDNGSGIGLSLSRHIMSLHGSTIRVHSEKGRQTSFYLYFQRTPEDVPAMV